MHGLNRANIRAAREFTVSLFHDTKKGPPPGTRPLTMEATGVVAPDWYLLENDAQYDSVVGLAPGDEESIPSRSGFYST